MLAAENTLIIVKPDFMDKRNGILQLLQNNGFRITHRKIVNFSPELAAEFYKELEKYDPCFPIKVMSLSKGPSEAIVLNKVNAIRDILTIITSSCDLSFGLEYKIHTSISVPNAKTEIRFIFPNFVFEPARKPCFGSICGRTKMAGLFADGTFAACNGKAEDAREFISKWMMEHSYEYEPDADC